jgi:hypothetical protein
MVQVDRFAAPMMSVVVVLAVAVGTLNATDEPVEMGVPPGCGVVEAEFQRAKATRDWTGVKRELAKLFSSASPDVQGAAMEWVGFHRADFTISEEADFVDLYASINPASPMAAGFRIGLANRKLGESDATLRAAVARDALEHGEVMFDGVLRLTAASALLMAAAEGRDEFLPYLDAYAGELDKNYPLPDCRLSEVLRWSFRLRAGARDARDALTVQAKNLAAMDQAAVAQLYASDCGFVRANYGVASQLCKDQLSDGCRAIAKVAEAQERLYRAHLKATGTGDTSGPPPDDPNWLTSLIESTATTRSTMKREEEAAKR